jgi:conjugative transposon TraN protein
MKKIIYLFAILLASLHTYAQNTPFANGVKKTALPIIYLPDNVSVHFISPEPIQYVDISTKSIIGDLPLKNVLRIKEKDSLKTPVDAIVTIAGEKFIAQYHVISAGDITGRDVITDIDIQAADSRPLDIAGIGLSQPQLKNMALNLFCKKRGHEIEHTKAFGLYGSVYHIYAADDYFFIDLGYANNTNLVYDIDEFRFKIDDKKAIKAANSQSVEVQPEYVLFDNHAFKKYYRNIYVFKKMSFPGNKVLHIELSEKQLSGRIITLTVSYKDILDADIIPF